MSLPEPTGLDLRGSSLPRRDPRAAGGPQGASWSTRANTRAWPRRHAIAGPTHRPDGRPRLVGQRLFVRRLCLRPPAAVDRDAGLDHPDRLLRRPSGHARLHRDRALTVGPHTGRRRLPRPRAAAPAPSRSRSRTMPAPTSQRAAEAVLPLAAGPEHSVAASKTYLNQIAALGSFRRVRRDGGPALRRGHPGDGRPARGDASSARGAGRGRSRSRSPRSGGCSSSGVGSSSRPPARSR